MKSSLEGLNSKFEQAEKRICNPEDMSIEIIQPEEQKEKRIYNEQRPVEHHQGTNIDIMGESQKERGQRKGQQEYRRNDS